MTFDKVKAILIDQLDVDEDKVTMDASIFDDLGHVSGRGFRH